MRNSWPISRNCCGGPLLILTLLCMGVGVLFLTLSATAPGLIFIGVGVSTECLCIFLSRTRCTNDLNE